MALATYSDLLASIASWMNRTDLGSIIPDFVVMAEARFGQDLRTRRQLTTSTLTTSTTTRAVALPTDWLEFENVSIDGTPDTSCQYVVIEHMDAKYPEGGWASRPFVYTIEGSNVLFGPQPDAAYTVNVMYYAKIPALASASTNWLMTNYPNVYLFGCLREGALFTMNDERATHWETLYQQAVKQVQNMDDQATHSGSALRVKAV